MSIKIYNGYKIDNPALTTLSGLMQFLKTVQTEALDLAKTNQVTMFAHILTNKIDNGATNEPYITFLKEYLEKINEIEEKNIRDPFLDFSYKVTFFPHEDSVFALLFTEKKIFVDHWNSFPFIKEYVYFNNTDKPKEISIEEWQKREEDWSTVLEFNSTTKVSTPATLGLSHDIISNDILGLPTIEEILKHIPSDDDRAKNLAIGILIKEMIGEDTEKVYEALRKIKEQDIEQKAKEVFPTLIPITREILIGKKEEEIKTS